MALDIYMSPRAGDRSLPVGTGVLVDLNQPPAGLRLELIGADKVAGQFRAATFEAGVTCLLGPGTAAWCRGDGVRPLARAEWSARAKGIQAAGGVMNVKQLPDFNLWWFRPKGLFARGTHVLKDVEADRWVSVLPVSTAGHGRLWTNVLKVLAGCDGLVPGRTWDEDMRQLGLDDRNEALRTFNPVERLYFGLGAAPGKTGAVFGSSVIHIPTAEIAADPDHKLRPRLRAEEKLPLW